MVALHIRAPGDWYALQSGVVVADGRMETNKHGNGKTPEDAAVDHFEVLTTYKPGEYLRVQFCGNTRNVRWNGFMWVDVEPEKAR